MQWSRLIFLLLCAVSQASRSRPHVTRGRTDALCSSCFSKIDCPGEYITRMTQLINQLHKINRQEVINTVDQRILNQRIDAAQKSCNVLQDFDTCAKGQTADCLNNQKVLDYIHAKGIIGFNELLRSRTQWTQEQLANSHKLIQQLCQQLLPT